MAEEYRASLNSRSIELQRSIETNEIKVEDMNGAFIEYFRIMDEIKRLDIKRCQEDAEKIKTMTEEIQRLKNNKDNKKTSNVSRKMLLTLSI